MKIQHKIYVMNRLYDNKMIWNWTMVRNIQINICLSNKFEINIILFNRSKKLYIEYINRKKKFLCKSNNHYIYMYMKLKTYCNWHKSNYVCMYMTIICKADISTNIFIKTSFKRKNG